MGDRDGGRVVEVSKCLRDSPDTSGAPTAEPPPGGLRPPCIEFVGAKWREPVERAHWNMRVASPGRAGETLLLPSNGGRDSLAYDVR